jgi:SH3-like domain-containing protein
MRRHLAFLLLAAWIGTIGVAEAQRQPPYWASIAAGQALMRTGPAQTYPATWLYVRPDLPIKVIGVRGDWRRVQDPDGTMGWMLVRLLSDQRSGIVRGQDAAADARIRQPRGGDPLPRRAGRGRPRLRMRGRLVPVRRRRPPRLHPVDTLWGVEATESIG